MYKESMFSIPGEIVWFKYEKHIYIYITISSAPKNIEV